VAVIDYPLGAALDAQQATGWLAHIWQSARATAHWITGQAATITYVHANEIGAPIAASDESGRIIWRASYTAYGLRRAVDGAKASGFVEVADRAAQQPSQGARFDLNLRLPGQYFDAETGWSDNGLRTYDPRRGQYLEPDPLGATPNRVSARRLTQAFGYANEDPLIYADPLGLILFAFDGTNNGKVPPEADTWSNVYKFYLAYDQKNNGPKWYMNGVGIDDPESGITGGALDAGVADSAHARVAYMLEQLNNYIASKTFEKGEVVNLDVVGFSRGAAMARDFVNRVVEHIAEGGYGAKGKCINIRFEGLWDTVAQFGLNGMANHTWELDIPVEAQHVFQAVAVNEHRALFPGESISRGIQKGFVGSHADIGGSYGSGDLSDVALNWMVKMAADSGIAMKPWSDKDVNHPEWSVVTDPYVHDKNTDGGDRKFCLRKDGELFPPCVPMSEAAVPGLDTKAAVAFIDKLKSPSMDSDGVSPIIGIVDARKYQKWLKDNYGLDISISTGAFPYPPEL
jgi:RHS repeat-associated protein